MRYTAIANLDATNYQRHALHGEQNAWVEKNCYLDLWLEVLYALKLEPLAMLPFVVSIDFEGDQWTFFKPLHGELRDLYGVEVQELTVWRPLLEHAEEHLAAGKLISTEADAFWLPDTSATDYRRQHTKTTIVLNDLDVANQRLGYFHNAGYYTLENEDFINTFRIGAASDPTFLPLFAEFIRIDRLVRHSTQELARLSRELLHKHLQFRPTRNPFLSFQERFERDLPWLQEKGLLFYHQWAFGTVRQVGAGFELAARNLQWLTAAGQQGLETAAGAFEEIANTNKTFILKGARAVNLKRSFDAAPMFAQMANAWQRGMDSLV